MPHAPRQSIVVVDDFLPRPDELVREAATLPFFERPFDPTGRASRTSRFAPAVKRRVCRVADTSIAWRRRCGHFRKTTLAEVTRHGRLWSIHTDAIFDLVALIYLSPPRHCHGGTGFFRHLRTGLDGFHDEVAVARAMRRLRVDLPTLLKQLRDDIADVSKWTQTDLVQMRFNRAVIYDGRMFHSHVLAFDTVAARATRLTFAVWGNRR